MPHFVVQVCVFTYISYEYIYLHFLNVNMADFYNIYTFIEIQYICLCLRKYFNILLFKMQVRVVTFVYDPFKSPPKWPQIMYGSFEPRIRPVYVSDYLVHTSYICDVVGAHDVCFAIHLRATFSSRLLGAHGPWG